MNECSARRLQPVSPQSIKAAQSPGRGIDCLACRLLLLRANRLAGLGRPMAQWIRPPIHPPTHDQSSVSHHHHHPWSELPIHFTSSVAVVLCMLFEWRSYQPVVVVVVFVLLVSLFAALLCLFVFYLPLCLLWPPVFSSETSLFVCRFAPLFMLHPSTCLHCGAPPPLLLLERLISSPETS